MASSPEKPVDLTSDSDDDVQCIGIRKRSVPRRQPSTSKTIQPIQLKSAEQCEPDFTEKSSTGSRSNDSSAHCHSKGTFVTMAESLRKSNWDGFAEPCHRAPSTLRTPSPCTQNSDVSKSMMGIIGHSPVELHRKRNGNGSFSIGSKRSRHLSPVFVDHVTYRDSGTLVGQGGLNDTYQDLTRPRTREPTAEELKHSEVIILSDCDDGDDEILEITSGKWFSRPKKNVTRQLTIDDLVIDLDEQEDLFDREHEELVSREELILELHQEDHRESTRSLIEPPRNLPITHPWTSKNTISTGVGTIKHESFVELKSHNFLRIAMILKNPTSGEIRLRGHRLERTKNLNGRLPRKLNELCWIVEIDLDDVRLSTEQDMVEINVDDIIGLRDLRITNQLFPSCSFRETGGFYNEWDAEHKAHCTARWKYSCTYDTAKDRRNNKWIEKCLEHLHNGDLYGDDRGRFTVSDTGLRFSYRGETVLGGAYGGPEQSNGKRSSAVINVDDEDGPNPCDEIDLTEDDEAEFERIRRSVSVMGLSNKAGQVSSNIGCRDSYNKAPPQTNTQNHCTRQLPQSINLLGSEIIAPPRIGSICAQDTGFVFESVNQLVRLPGQKYTYGDGFCGAGGATRGALMAGLKPIWGFDANHHACSSWRLNFPDAVLHEEWADQFVQRGLGNSNMKADVIHVSPPCQYFSPAHTVAGKDDEINSASLFACGHILDVAKPRVVTLEQTFGIVLLPRFQAYFNALINMFTDRSFSVRWKVVQLQNWGLPQRRQRLIIIASCPGEALPEFPPFTHADPGKPLNGLKPWVSVNSVIRNIPRGAPNHDLEMQEANPISQLPWSGDLIAPRCITTHGGQNYHPSGKRGFTNREYACLQGFPMNHRFSEVNVKKQIGNAVPPSIAKVLFSWIKKALEKADGVQPEDVLSDIQHSGNFQTEAIVLD